MPSAKMASTHTKCIDNDTLRRTSKLYWSDHMAIAYNEVVAKTKDDLHNHFGGTTKALETVWRYLIANTDTQAVIRAVRHRNHQRDRIFEVDNKRFSGVVGHRQWQRHRKNAGRVSANFRSKDILHARLIKVVGNELCWVLQDSLDPEPAFEPEQPTIPTVQEAPQALLSKRAARNPTKYKSLGTPR